MSDSPARPVDPLVLARYEAYDEDARLWRPGLGDLVRLRTWDILDRFQPPGGRVLDVGGGPGTHAAHLAGRGDTVTLIDPVPRHVERARARAREPGAAPFTVSLADATRLPVPSTSADAVVLMGPLYHLVGRADRLAALTEARRALRPGGLLVAEVITRHAWTLYATVKARMGEAAVRGDVERTVATGLTQDPSTAVPGSSWAYFHHLDELEAELAETGFEQEALVAVEGFAWLLGDLAGRMREPSRPRGRTADRARAVDARLLGPRHGHRPGSVVVAGVDVHAGDALGVEHGHVAAVVLEGQAEVEAVEA